MTRALRPLQTVYACDYRVLEAPRECGCQGPRIRCLLGNGTWDADRHDVTNSDCLICMKGGENGRTMDANPSSPARGDRTTDGDRGAPEANRGDRAAGSKPVVSVVNENGLEQEILRLEREVQQLWVDVRLAMNFRSPYTEQNQTSLSNSLKGGGFPVGPSGPNGFGCDGGMPNTIYWYPPITTDDAWDGTGTGSVVSLTYDAPTNTYSGSGTANIPSACGCTGSSFFGELNVPVQITYTPTGVTTSFWTDGSGCPKSLADAPGGHYDSFHSSPPSFSSGVCDLSNPLNMLTQPASPDDTSAGTPACKMGYTPGDGDTFYGGGITQTGCYIPRSLYLKIYKTSDNSLVDSSPLHFAGNWDGSVNLVARNGQQYWTGTSSYTYNMSPAGTCPTETANITFIAFFESGSGTVYAHWPFASHLCADSVTRNCYGFGSDSTNDSDWQVWGLGYGCFPFYANRRSTPSGGHITTCGTASPFDCTVNALYMKIHAGS